MLRTESVDDRLSNSPDEEGYDFYPIESGQGYYLKFTPPSDTKLCTRLYPSRLLSKSVPRRKRNLVNFKINRSLQFNSSINSQELPRRSDSFLSPKSVGHSSINKNVPLSRSAKILKALNIEYSPVLNSEYKKINKTLKFDLSPNSNRFKSPIPSTASNSRCNSSNSSIKSSVINKSLNFDSCDDSPVASAHDTSIESIDENQNQTPSSQKSKKIKKTLSYLSLSSSGSGTSSSFEFNLLSSPGLRTELREKIDDIVVTSMMSTPQSKLFPGHKKLINNDEIAASTPRNLFKDFMDDEIDVDKNDDDNDNQERPETPVNIIQLIPEGMSAIKKSHRKERFTGSFMNRISQNSAEEPPEMNIESEERASTPLTSDVQKSPNFSIHSIKKSHKKDKSKKKLGVNQSEDELSDTGSLFDHSSIEEEKVKTNSPESKALAKVNDEAEFQTPPKTRQNKTQPFSPATPTASTSNVMTPENRIDFLKKIMTDSIKKSHKKLKDSNKKILFKSRLTERQQEIALRTNELNLNESPGREINPSKSPNTDAKIRSSTPENINSSRILISKFSSVKKSHRKDKHRKIGFAQRHIMMNDNIESSSPAIEPYKSPSKHLLNIPGINISAASTSKSSNNPTSIHHDNNRYHSLNLSVFDSEDGDFKLISTPNKRKSSNFFNSTSIEESNSEFKSIEDQCEDEEEFKMFTPMKKRKSFGIFNTNNVNQCVFSTPKKPVNDLCSDRCETPKLGINILLPGLNNGVEEYKNYNISNNNIKNKKRDDAICEGAQSDGDANGKQTPDNLNRIKMISSLSSIKKSHRKDKWAKVRTRKSSRLLVKKNKNSLNVKDDFEDLSMVDNTSWRSTNLTYDSSSDSMEKNESSEEPPSPKPSTSSINNNHTAAGSNAGPVATPPNCLQVKKYLMVLQNTSIKRSRKKMREKKKHDSIIVVDNDQDDGNLSDGSIFDEEQKKSDYESSWHIKNKDIKPLDDDNHDLTDKILKSTY